MSAVRVRATPPESQDEKANNWDFLTGRGEGATRADRAAARLQYAARALGATLARDATFNRYADELARAVNAHGVAVVAGPGDVARVRSAQAKAREYWPRASLRQDVVSHLLSLAANAENRTFALANAGGPRAYFVDAESTAYAVRPDYQRTIGRGALLIARRGAHRCLKCEEPLEDPREPQLGGDRLTHRRVDYCADCQALKNHCYWAPIDLQAMSDTLGDAASFVLPPRRRDPTSVHGVGSRWPGQTE